MVLLRSLKSLALQILAGITFYTCIPLPSAWTLEFRGIARIAPLIGLLIGGLVGLLDGGLAQVGIPRLTRSAIAIATWIAITGGLHLDGAIDTADGLAVPDPQRRLAVMTESTTGAFGVMAAAVILLLKTAALNDLQDDRGLALMAVAGWGRWGQLVAIARYPYLKPTGKGAFLKAAIRSPWEVVPGFLLLAAFSGLIAWLQPDRLWWAVGMVLGGMAIALATGAWLHHKLGGQTGDTYGAIVEWTEALLLCGLTIGQ